MFKNVKRNNVPVGAYCVEQNLVVSFSAFFEIGHFLVSFLFLVFVCFH